MGRKPMPPNRRGRASRESMGWRAGDLVERDGLLWAISEGAATTVDELVPAGVAGMVAALNFSKSMRWDHGRFSRPVRWLVVKVDDRVVPVELFGLVATGVSRGHRFLGRPGRDRPTPPATARTCAAVM